MQQPRIKRFGPGGPRRRIHLVAPRHPENFWSMQGTADLFGARTLMPNAALATLVALTPADAPIEYTLTDENVDVLDLSAPRPDLVAVTGGTLHAARIREICAAYRAQGVPVALGGTYASIDADRCRGLADHLFVGEAEHTWPRFLSDWLAGNARPTYRQRSYIDLADSPPPDWSLIDPGDYLNLSVQTTRGCPNRCDFCDVIQYVGRRTRTKSVDQVLTEVRNAHALGARSVFFSDDNFLGKPAFTRALLAALIDWNRTQERPLSFSTQITMQVADDDALLRQFADARFSVLFLGVETVRRESLAEVHKAHNLKRDPRERLRRISRHGIVPFIGLIVGFDHDDAAVFDELERFVDDTDTPIAGISLLNAPRHTPLYERLEREGRLVGEDFSGEWQLETNVIPKLLSPEELRRRYWDLFSRLYDPERFAGRLTRWLAGVEYQTSIYTRKRFNPRPLLSLHRLLRAFLLGRDSRRRALLWRSLRQTWTTDRRLLSRTLTLLAQFHHFQEFVARATATAGAPSTPRSGRSPGAAGTPRG